MTWKTLPYSERERLRDEMRAKVEAQRAARGYEKPDLPFRPHPRQAEFLALDCEEALFGGAAGPGKSEALLMWLAEGINNPRYSAVAFRRTFPQLSKADGLIPKSRQMYLPMGGSYKETTKTWTFPSGATIELGHLQYDKDTDDYQGAAYTRIAFDELTQFSEHQYTYLFSRLGRTDIGIKPGMRAASNPGGIGHAWVKSRFITKEAIEAIRGLSSRQPSPPGMVFWNGGRAFVPARIADNPSLNVEDYSRRLAENLDPVTRERLLNGDWAVSKDGRIKSAWFRWYTMQGEYYRIPGQNVIHENQCQRHMLVDCAATSEEVARQERQKPPSYSAIMVTDWTPSGLCLVRYVRRGLWDFPELRANAEEVYNTWRPAWMGIENEKTGLALLQTLRSRYNVRALEPKGKDKLTRAASMLNMMEQGRIHFPEPSVLSSSWVGELRDEMTMWTGHPDETADQIDALAYDCRLWQLGAPQHVVLAAPIYGAGISGGEPFGGNW